jgi:probable HAF family extracellular repeat protein
MADAGLRYSITPLGNFVPNGINNRGDVIGYSLETPDAQAAILRGNTLTLLNPPGDLSYANDINDAGQTVGWYSDSAGPGAGTLHGFLYSGGIARDLGASVMTATAINNAGVIGGALRADNGADTHGFVYDHGVITDINPGAPPGSTVAVTGINNAGVLVGAASFGPGGQPLPFRYDHRSGVTTDLSSFIPGHDSADTRQYTTIDINDAGNIVISSLSQELVLTSYLYAGGAATELGDLGLQQTQATGINNAGLVVGYSEDGVLPGSTSGFVWKDGQIYNVNSLLAPGSDWNVAQLFGVNDAGQIAAFGCRSTDLGSEPTDCQGLLLTAGTVPEAGTVALMLAGLAMVGIRVRRMRIRLALSTGRAPRAASTAAVRQNRA